MERGAMWSEDPTRRVKKDALKKKSKIGAGQDVFD